MNPKPHPRIPLPVDLFTDRKNSHGVLLSDPSHAEPLMKAVAQAVESGLEARPIVGGVLQDGRGTAVFDPSKRSRQIGTVLNATPEMAARASLSAAAAQFSWDAAGG